MNPTVYVKQLHLAALEKQQLLPALVEGIFKKNHNIQFEKQAFPETVLEILYIWRKNKGNPFLSSNVSILWEKHLLRGPDPLLRSSKGIYIYIQSYNHSYSSWYEIIWSLRIITMVIYAYDHFFPKRHEKSRCHWAPGPPRRRPFAPAAAPHCASAAPAPTAPWCGTCGWWRRPTRRRWRFTRCLDPKNGDTVSWGSDGIRQTW